MKGRADDPYERDPYGEKWPRCYGRCSRGHCVLDKSRPGCCYRRGGKYSHTEAALPEHAHVYAAANLMCWGHDEGY
jgi:hypothetical protein